MARGPIRGTATQQDTGKSCPFCRFPIKERDDVVACGECHSTHHDDCWEENGGCAVPGCAGGPSEVASGGTGGSHIPPKAGPSKKKVTIDPRPSMRRRKRERQRKKPPARGASTAAPTPPGRSSKTTLWIVGTAVAFLAVIGVILISNNFGDTDPASGKSCEDGTGKNGVPCYSNGKLPNIPTSEMQRQVSRFVRGWFRDLNRTDWGTAWSKLSPRVKKQINLDLGFRGWQANQFAMSKYAQPKSAKVTITKPNYPDEGVLSVYIANMPYTKKGDLCEKREGVTWVVWDPEAKRWFHEPGAAVTKQRKADWGYQSTKLFKYSC